MAKSWDIQPSKGAARPSAPRPTAPARRFEDMRPAPPTREAARRQPVRRAAPMPTRRESGRISVPSPRTPLKQRRKQQRKRLVRLSLIALGILFVLFEVVLWQPWLRVNTVNAEGPDQEGVQAYVLGQLSGTRFLIAPKNSIFFIPAERIRTGLLAQFPDIAAVSIAPSGLTTLSVKATPRGAVAWWCGASLGAPLDTCYQTDSQGFIFAIVPLDQRYATDSTLSLYAPLTKDLEGTSSPVGSTVANASALPPLLQFVKAVRALNADVVSLDIRGDEADLYTRGNTRITYVLGREMPAANLAASSFPKLNLNDGSLLYVDLRFDGKVFFKKK